MKSLDAYAAYLAQRHAEDQERITASLALALYPLWSLVEFRALDASMLTWLPAVLPKIHTAFLQSQRVTAVFTQNVRFASLPLEDPLPITVPDVQKPRGLSAGAFDMPDLGVPAPELEDIYDEFPEADVATSLTIEADYNTKKAMPGPEKDLMHNANVRSAGAAIRHTVNGSRGVTDNLVKRDRKILGYARVTDSNPCYFCALLASRGAVYAKDAFSKNRAGRVKANKAHEDFTPNPNGAKNLPEGFLDIARVHNNCKCTLRPVYTKASSMDAAAKYWRDKWDKIYDKNPYRSNAEMIKDFKDWHESNPFPGNQFDLHSLDRDLQNRRDSLLDAGFDAKSPQVKWAERARKNLAA